MTEQDMEELLWKFPGKLLNEPLEPFRRQPSSQVGRADLIFKDRLGRFLVVEIKKGTLPRGAVNQLVDYYGMLKREFHNESVELMAVAHFIPEDRAIACLKYDIEPREISEKRFLDVAREVGYPLESEREVKDKAGKVDSAPQAGTALSRPGPGSIGLNRVERAWYFSPSGLGKPAFLAFVNAKGNCSMRVFDAEDGSFLGRRYTGGDYREAFREYILEATPVTVTRQPSLENECKQQLPSAVLAQLKRQVLKPIEPS
jgi:hypothetical protein